MEKTKNLICLVSVYLLATSIVADGVTIEDHPKGWMIETKNAKWLFEAKDEISGLGGLWSNDGKDWLQCFSGPMQPLSRGFPNSVGNFGHPNRPSGSVNTIRGDKRSGDHVIIDSENNDLHFAYHFFETHLTIEVLKAKTGYHFLLETTPGQEILGKYWMPSGELGVLQDHQELSPEWLYLTDRQETSDYMLLAVKTPDDDAPNETWQIDNRMMGFSWGRYGRSRAWEGGHLSGLEHKISLTMVPAGRSHEEIDYTAEQLIEDHFAPLEPPKPNEED